MLGRALLYNNSIFLSLNFLKFNKQLCVSTQTIITLYHIWQTHSRKEFTATTENYTHTHTHTHTHTYTHTLLRYVCIVYMYMYMYVLKPKAKVAKHAEYSICFFLYIESYLHTTARDSSALHVHAHANKILYIIHVHVHVRSMYILILKVSLPCTCTCTQCCVVLALGCQNGNEKHFSPVK